MAVYYIFRHGETFASRAGIGYGWRVFSAPILPEGIPAIERMGEYLKTKKADQCYSSPLTRCRQTVKIISAKTNQDFIFDNRLSEFFLETFGFFRRRIESFIKEVEEKKYETVFVCTHGAVIAALHYLLSDIKFELSHLSDYPDPGVLLIIDTSKKEGQRVKQLNFNQP